MCFKWVETVESPNRLLFLGHGLSVFQVAGCVFQNRPRSAIPAGTARRIMQVKMEGVFFWWEHELIDHRLVISFKYILRYWQDVHSRNSWWWWWWWRMMNDEWWRMKDEWWMMIFFLVSFLQTYTPFHPGMIPGDTDWHRHQHHHDTTVDLAIFVWMVGVLHSKADSRNWVIWATKNPTDSTPALKHQLFKIIKIDGLTD